MSKVGRSLRRFLGAPLRLVSRPFRELRTFLDYTPEDTPVADTLASTLENPSLLIEHIEALRRHLLRSILALIITTGISFAFANRVLEWLAKPIGGTSALQAIEVTESIGSFMRVSLMSGFVLAFPYILVEFFSFVNPGLKRQERIFILVAAPMALVLFLAGLAFSYYVMLPAALPFLLNFLGITTVPRPSNYIRFVTGLMFWIGIAFQFPLIIYILARLGVVRARTLVDGWRIAIVGIAVLAAAVTPTIDPVNMALVMAPMTGLYFLSIGLAAIAQRSRERAEARSQSGHQVET
jgi:sec-independent protein translocase protein TatC